MTSPIGLLWADLRQIVGRGHIEWTELAVTSGAPIGYRRRQSVSSSQSATAFGWPDVTYADFYKTRISNAFEFFSPPSECEREVDRTDETRS